MSNAVVQKVVRRDRNVVLVGLAAVVAVATIYTVNMARSLNQPVPLLHVAAHGGDSFLTLFTMWTVMQVAMMSPTAVPMLLMFAKISRHRRPEASPYPDSAIFFAGYIVVWAVFSAIVALVQMRLQSADLLSPMMASSSPWLAGGILIAAGLFQFSRLKQACLNQCRSPVTYLMTEWREGRGGALLMGLKHGAHCVGCCWILMALLFVAGVMNLFWMAAITAFVLVEKLTPQGELFGRVGGALFIIWGLFLLA